MAFPFLLQTGSRQHIGLGKFKDKFGAIFNFFASISVSYLLLSIIIRQEYPVHYLCRKRDSG